MFTGIIEEIGSLQSIKQHSKTLELCINAKLILEDIHVGDSIAVNGVCLTVTSFDNNSFSADVMPVTYTATNLAELKYGDKINLERAIAANGRFGGHIVSGHVDATGSIISKTRIENAVIYQIKIPSQLRPYCISKGSIALDGTSLTIVEVGEDWLSVSLIPHTQEKSVLGMKNIGDSINIECDILAKHVLTAFFVAQDGQFKPKIDFSFLKENGFT